MKKKIKTIPKIKTTPKEIKISKLQAEIFAKDREIASLRESLKEPVVRLAIELAEKLSQIDYKLLCLEKEFRNLEINCSSNDDSYH